MSDASIRKFLIQLIEDRIERREGDTILAKWKNHKHIPVLRNLGFIDGPERLTEKAFLEFFDTYEIIPCPAPIQKTMEVLGITKVRWRRARGVLLKMMRRAQDRERYPRNRRALS